MKRVAVLALVGGICLGITACGSKESVNESKTEVTRATSDSSVDSSEKNVKVTPKAQDTTKATEQKKNKASDSETEFLKDATIEETVLYEENGVKITATGLTYNSSSVEIDITIENGTDKNLSFISNSLGYACNSVNGYMIDDGYVNCAVSAGKTAKESVQIGYDELLMYGINELADIEIGFDISDDDYNSIYTGARQLLTSAAETYEYKEDGYRTAIRSDAIMSKYNYTIPYFNDEIMSEQDGVDVLSAGLIEQENGETALFLEVKNTSDQAVYATTGDICVNGLGVYGATWSSDMINAGKTRIITVKLNNIMSKNIYEAYGINEYGEVSLELALEDSDGNEIGTPANITVRNPNVGAEFDANGQEVYNANNIRIIMKKLVEDEADYSDDINVLFIVENNNEYEVWIDYSHDSLSINNVMFDAWGDFADMKGNSRATLQLVLPDSDLQEQGISSVDDINEMEMAFSIRDSQYNDIDEPVISISMEEN